MVGQSSNWVVRIKHRMQAEILIEVAVFFPFAFGLLVKVLQFREAIKYVCDGAWACLVIYVSLYLVQRKAWSETQRNLLLWVLAFLVYTLGTYIIDFQSVLYYIWGARNNFRFYVLFVSCMLFLRADNIEKYLGLFDTLFWLEICLCLVRYYVLGYKQDQLGSLQALGEQGNGYLNLLFVLISTKALVYYLNKRISLLYCAVQIGVTLWISALAELKFFFVEIVLIVVLASLISRFTWRKFIVMIGVLIGVLLAAALLVVVFPGWDGFFSLEYFVEMALSDQGYTGRGDLNRLNCISRISQMFLTTFPQQLFGMGLGNCDTSAFDFLNTPFFKQNGYLHYNWFSTAFTFLETGYIGLFFFFGFFVLVFFQTKKILRTASPQRKLYCQMAMIMAVCCVAIGVYNSSLRTEGGYMAYFILALPFIKERISEQIADVSK